MTRLICGLLCLGLGTASAQTLNYETIPATGITTLTADNVLWAAYYLDPHTDPKQRSHDFLRVREPQRHASNMHDQAALDAEAAVVDSEIREQVSKIDKSLRYSLGIEAVADKVEGDKVHLTTPFDIGIYDLETNFGSNSRYLPPLYELLIANMDHYSGFPVGHAVAIETEELLKQKGPRTAFLQVELELVALQQGHRFQTVLRNIKWYRDPEHTQLMAELSDKRPASKLVKARMLSEGVTFEASPEHAYTVSDERIMETLIENHPRKQRTCKEEAREQGHRVFLCEWTREFVNGMPSRSTYRYVGGRLAEVLVYYTGSENATDAARANIWHVAQYEHMGPSKPPDDQPTQWAFGGAQFRYDGKQAVKGATEPYYQAIALRYLDLKAGKPGTGVVP